MRSRVATVLASLLLVAPAGLAACGGDDDASGTGATDQGSTATTEDYVIVSDQAVATGLADTTAKMTALAAAPETATDAAVVEVYDLWGSYEGTVKQNEPDMYLNFEDTLGVFKKGAESGDAVGMQSAISDFSNQAAQYLAAHPG